MSEYKAFDIGLVSPAMAVAMLAAKTLNPKS